MINSRGFTVVELVVCIVLIGILSAVAMPRLLGMQQQSRAALLDNAKASLSSANQLVYTKALLQSQHQVIASSRYNIDLDGDGHNDLMGYYGLIKNVNPAEELAGLDPQLQIYRGNKNDPNAPYFAVRFVDRPSELFPLCQLSVYYPSVAGGQVRYRISRDDC